MHKRLAESLVYSSYFINFEKSTQHKMLIISFENLKTL
jgi:hypothetical protein